MKLPPASPRQSALNRLLPPHVGHALRFEARMVPVRLRSSRNRRAFRGSENLAVNIGAGSRGRPGWINVDAFDGPEITCRHDCRWSLPFPDGSVEMLFSEHFLEHLERTVEVPRFLGEVNRVLKVGGRLRVVVPDVERYLVAYCARDWDALARIRPLVGRRDRWFDVEYETHLELAQFVMRQLPAEPHQYGYDDETLALALRAAAFTDVHRCELGVGTRKLVELETLERGSESLYYEAVKG